MGLDQETPPGQLLWTWRAEARDALGRKVLEGLLVAGLWESTMGRTRGYWFWAAQTAEMPPHTARVAGDLFPRVGDTRLLIMERCAREEMGGLDTTTQLLKRASGGTRGGASPGLRALSYTQDNSVPRHADADGEPGPQAHDTL